MYKIRLETELNTEFIIYYKSFYPRNLFIIEIIDVHKFDEYVILHFIHHIIR